MKNERNIYGTRKAKRNVKKDEKENFKRPKEMELM